MVSSDSNLIGMDPIRSNGELARFVHGVGVVIQKPIVAIRGPGRVGVSDLSEQVRRGVASIRSAPGRERLVPPPIATASAR